MADFNFQPFVRPQVSAPVDAFSDLITARKAEYEAGELITEQAKDVFGLLEVAPGDQEMRNGLAAEVDTKFNDLLGKYDGAYESSRFQRDAKALIRELGRDPRLTALRETLEKHKEVSALQTAARAGKARLINFQDEATPVRTVFNPETGLYETSGTNVETARDWYDAGSRIMSNIASDMVEGVPQEKLMAGLRAIVSTAEGGTSRDKVSTIANNSVDNFIGTDEGNQFARLAAFKMGVNLEDENGNLNPDVRRKVAEFLISIGEKQVNTRSQYNFQFLPGQTTKKEEGPTNPGYTTIPLVDLDVSSAVTGQLGYTPGRITKDKGTNEGPPTSFKEGMISTPVVSGTPTRGVVRNTEAPTDDQIAKRREQYNKDFAELAPILFPDNPSIDPNSPEAVAAMQQYVKTASSYNANLVHIPFEDIKGDTALRRREGNNELANARDRAVYDVTNGRLLTDSQRAALFAEDPTDNFTVLGITDYKTVVPTIINNDAFVSGFYIQPKEGKGRYIIARKQSELDSVPFETMKQYNKIYTAANLTPGLTRSIGDIGGVEVSIKGEIQDASLNVTGYSVFVDGQELRTSGGEKVRANGPEQAYALIMWYLENKKKQQKK